MYLLIINLKPSTGYRESGSTQGRVRSVRSVASQVCRCIRCLTAGSRLATSWPEPRCSIAHCQCREGAHEDSPTTCQSQNSILSRTILRISHQLTLLYLDQKYRLIGKSSDHSTHNPPSTQCSLVPNPRPSPMNSHFHQHHQHH